MCTIADMPCGHNEPLEERFWVSRRYPFLYPFVPISTLSARQMVPCMADPEFSARQIGTTQAFLLGISAIPISVPIYTHFLTLCRPCTLNHDSPDYCSPVEGTLPYHGTCHDCPAAISAEVRRRCKGNYFPQNS